jgi:hypothetical protein
MGLIFFTIIMLHSICTCSGSACTTPWCGMSGTRHSYDVRSSCRLLGSSPAVYRWWTPPRWRHLWTGGVRRLIRSTFWVTRPRWHCRTLPWSLVSPSIALRFVGQCLQMGGGTPSGLLLAFNRRRSHRPEGQEVIGHPLRVAHSSLWHMIDEWPFSNLNQFLCV